MPNSLPPSPDSEGETIGWVWTIEIQQNDLGLLYQTWEQRGGIRKLRTSSGF